MAKYFYVAQVKETVLSKPYEINGIYETWKIENNILCVMQDLLKERYNAEDIFIITFTKIED